MCSSRTPPAPRALCLESPLKFHDLRRREWKQQTLESEIFRLVFTSSANSQQRPAGELQLYSASWWFFINLITAGKVQDQLVRTSPVPAVCCPSLSLQHTNTPTHQYTHTRIDPLVGSQLLIRPGEDPLSCLEGDGAPSVRLLSTFDSGFLCGDQTSQTPDLHH